jgi:hypothetical protein
MAELRTHEHYSSILKYLEQRLVAWRWIQVRDQLTEMNLIESTGPDAPGPSWEDKARDAEEWDVPEPPGVKKGSFVFPEAQEILKKSQEILRASQSSSSTAPLKPDVIPQRIPTQEETVIEETVQPAHLNRQPEGKWDWKRRRASRLHSNL